MRGWRARRTGLGLTRNLRDAGFVGVPPADKHDCLMNRKQTGLSRFDRIPLVFAVRRNARGFVSSSQLVPLAEESPDAHRCVTASLIRLCECGLIELRQREGRSIEYRRTSVGVALAEQMLADRRFSFRRAIARPGDDRDVGR